MIFTRIFDAVFAISFPNLVGVSGIIGRLIEGTSRRLEKLAFAGDRSFAA